MSAALSIAKPAGPEDRSTQAIAFARALSAANAAAISAMQTWMAGGRLNERRMNVAVPVQSGPWSGGPHAAFRRKAVCDLCAEICASPAGRSLRLWRAKRNCCAAQLSIGVNRQAIDEHFAGKARLLGSELLPPMAAMMIRARRWGGRGGDAHGSDETAAVERAHSRGGGCDARPLFIWQRRAHLARGTGAGGACHAPGGAARRRGERGSEHQIARRSGHVDHGSRGG